MNARQQSGFRSLSDWRTSPEGDVTPGWKTCTDFDSVSSQFSPVAFRLRSCGPAKNSVLATEVLVRLDEIEFQWNDGKHSAGDSEHVMLVVTRKNL